jgi:hypothetical protein
MFPLIITNTNLAILYKAYIVQYTDKGQFDNVAMWPFTRKEMCTAAVHQKLKRLSLWYDYNPKLHSVTIYRDYYSLQNLLEPCAKIFSFRNSRASFLSILRSETYDFTINWQNWWINLNFEVINHRTWKDKSVRVFCTLLSKKQQISIIQSFIFQTFVTSPMKNVFTWFTNH